MIKVTVRRRQTLSDIALEVYGSIEGVVSLARANNISITGELHAGEVLQCPDVIYDNYLQSYVRRNGIVPATAYDGRGEITQRIFTEEFTPEYQ